jgi:hypothetical protein
MPFASMFGYDPMSNFTYCIQNMQTNYMGYLLQPVQYNIGVIGSVGGNLTKAVNDIRAFFNNIRNFITNIVQSIFGVFLNITVELQRITISIKDMVGKMIGLITTILFLLDGSIKTMNSAWSGPPGQLVRAIGSCFDPKTKITLEDGKQYEMENIPLGSILKDGGKVFAVLKVDNTKKEPLYKIKGNYQDIFVTGEHFVYDKTSNKWIQVKDYKKSTVQPNKILEHFSCLITTNGRIAIDNELFWDWEDDVLTHNKQIIRV